MSRTASIPQAASLLLLLLLLIQLAASAPSYLQPAAAAASSSPTNAEAAPVITPFAFNAHVEERQRASVLCTIASGELSGLVISWLKDGQLISPHLAQARNITIKSDQYESTLKLAPVRLEHAGNYTCLARNHAGVQAHSAQLIVHGEPRWVREPRHGPLVASRGQTVVIDCPVTGWPKPVQTWQIKTRTQTDYEPLAATGRISLAANGSLVIKNADKMDEANYLCRSSNGIGKGISYSTSLKVTVPAHFESAKQQITVVRKMNQVQLRCDAYGDEPLTIEWFKNKQRLTNDFEARYSIHNTPFQTGLISLLLIRQAQRQDDSVYECVARNSAGRDTLPIELLVQEEPDHIQEFQVKANSRSATLYWSEPYDGRSPINEYMFQYKRVQPDSEFLENGQEQAVKLTGVDDWQNAERILLPAQQATNLGSKDRSINIERLEPSTRYVLRALSINAMGQSKFSQPMEFSTAEESPELAPTSVLARAINSTSIHVSWDEIPRSKSRILGYYIGYRAAGALHQHPPTTSHSSNHQHHHHNQQQQQQLINVSTLHGFIYKPYLINDQLPSGQQSAGSGSEQQRLEFTLHELRRDTAYEITVLAFNGRGSGPSSEFVLCKTVEMERPKPVRVAIRRESNESIFIEWQRDPSDQNPVDGFILYQEKNSASQEWLQIRLPGNQTHYKAPGLKCGTRYQFYVVAYNKIGKSDASDVVSALTSGTLARVPSKSSLIKMLNSTCLMLNLNSFHDNGCRVKTFTVRYRLDRTTGGSGGGSSSSGSQASMLGSNSGLHSMNAAGVLGAGPSSLNQPAGDWVSIHPSYNDEDRIKYMCNLNPVAEYTIHVAAQNDVGRAEIEYSVLMSSDELRASLFKDLAELLHGLPNVFAYIPSLIVFLLAGLFISLVSLILYTTVCKYYQKLVIMQNQMRATRRAKRDERRRRKLNSIRHSQKHLDLWADEYEEEEEGDDPNDEEEPEEVGDGDDEDDDGHSGSSSSGTRRMLKRAAANQYVGGQSQAAAAGHYLSNVSNSGFDSSSIDAPFGLSTNNKCNGSLCLSSASSDSIHGPAGGRFQCLSSKQCVRMNEYTMLPTISARLSPPNSVDMQRASVLNQQQVNNNNTNNNSIYYSTLRRTNMQTYLPPTRQPGHQQQLRSHQQAAASLHRRQSQNMAADIYGYYMGPPGPADPAVAAAQQQVAAAEAVNSIYVPPQQIIYSAPNIRRPPMFL